MEEYIISKSLYTMNEESEWTTFYTRRGSSNIDLTTVNDQLLKALKNWEICEEDSCSDHSIIKFHIGQCSTHGRQHYNYGIRYVVNEQNLDRFDKNLIESVATKFQKDNVKDLPSLDNELATHAKETLDIENVVDKLQEAIMLAWNNSFKTAETIPKWTNYKSVTLWTQELPIKRRRLNALRRRYQRTRATELRENRKKIYH